MPLNIGIENAFNKSKDFKDLVGKKKHFKSLHNIFLHLHFYISLLDLPFY